MKIRKGDEVVVLSGKYRGHKAAVVSAHPAEDKVVVDGVNIAKRHTKQTGSTMQAGIIDKYMPIPASTVALWCSKHDGPAKAGFKIEGDTKQRVCRKCGANL
ncbi:MAG: 50S ribosomal protein L24 [Actinomycetota bacterium]|jgi:large subunit ribosomal protein L24